MDVPHDHPYVSPLKEGWGGYAPDGPPRLAKSAPRGVCSSFGLPLAIPIFVVALEDALR